MLYAVISSKPFVFISSKDADLLKSDYDYITADFEELTSGNFTDAQMSPFEILDSQQLFKALKKRFPKCGTYYTFNEKGKLESHVYEGNGKYYYVDDSVAIRYNSYCGDSGIIRAGILCNEKVLKEKVTAQAKDLLLHTEDYDVEKLQIFPDRPVKQADVIGYVCIPIILETIPVGN